MNDESPRSKLRGILVIPSEVEGSTNLGRFLHSSTIVESVGMTTRFTPKQSFEEFFD